MPGGNRTGPAGLGPMTGRAAGYYAGDPVPGYMNPAPGGWTNPIPGRGWGSFGFGPGWMHPYSRGYYGYPGMFYGMPRSGMWFGRGWGRGRGRGRGWGRGRWFYGWGW